jgi:hypothetical protein
MSARTSLGSAILFPRRGPPGPNLAERLGVPSHWAHFNPADHSFAAEFVKFGSIPRERAVVFFRSGEMEGVIDFMRDHLDFDVMMLIAPEAAREDDVLMEIEVARDAFIEGRKS